MASTVLTILKVFGSVLLLVAVLFALLVGIGIGAAHWAIANCMGIQSLACSSASWLASWWWLTLLTLTFPLAAVSCFYSVRYFAAPGTRARVAGGVGIICGGALVISSLLSSHGQAFNWFGGVFLLMGLYLFVRKQKPLRAPDSGVGE